MKSKNAMLFIHAQTSLHPGTGTALGTVDMPIQRERHTDWPMIPGSSLKGVIREHCRPNDVASHAKQIWCDVFGAESGTDEPQAGAISFTDARILAFPVRSARGVFAWVTCKDVLDRLARDAKLADLHTDWISIGVLGEGSALLSSGALEIEGTKQLLLEEYDFNVDASAENKEVIKAIAKWLSEKVTSDDFTRERLKSHLVVLPDTEFTHFVRHATEVTARIGLDYKTKTVTSGALFYEEFLPPETLMYSVIIANASRRNAGQKKADEPSTAKEANGQSLLAANEVMKYLTDQLPQDSILQIGANETIGKGLCAISIQSN
jgi:CRISPR-associated protein Cmr4